MGDVLEAIFHMRYNFAQRNTRTECAQLPDVLVFLVEEPADYGNKLS